MGNKKLYFSVTEAIITILSVNLCYLIASAFDSIPAGFRWKVTWLVVNIALLPVVYFITKNATHRSLHIDKIIRKAFAATAIHALFFFAVLSFLNSWVHDISFYIWFYASMTILTPLSMIATRLTIKRLRSHGYNSSSAIIIGTGDTARRLRDEMLADAGYGYTFKGFFSKSAEDAAVNTENYQGSIDILDEYVASVRVDEIYFTLSDEDYEALRHVTSIANNRLIQLYVVPPISRYAGRVHALSSIGNIPYLSISANPLKITANRILKRTGDIIGSVLFLSISAIPLIIITAAIQLSSPGPILFKQKRTGYLGKDFICYKFRTMYINAMSDTMQARRHDRRVTPIGQFLRRTSLDELPQFFNVLRGDMSIVGPRPHMLSQTDVYAKLIDRYMVRHFIKPGITGWAQINGYRGSTEELWKMEKRVEYDVWYMENWSFMLDLKIITLTARHLLKRDNNAF